MASNKMAEMKKKLLERTKKNYDRREPDQGAKYFDPEAIADVKFWKAAATKGNPHIVDIIPFVAGDRFPNHSGVEEGDLVYSLDLWVHQNVGPGKTSVICPARNYGEPCPICDAIEEMVQDGMEWKDIPIIPRRRVIYNVIVMDDAKTEAQGIQVWDVSYKYMEDPILALSKSPRDGGVVAFAALDKATGKSVAFDVGNDTYRKITGHRFEPRDYDIPEDAVDQAVPLDQILLIHSTEDLERILYGSGGQKKEKGEVAEPEEEQQEEKSSRSSRLGRRKTEPDEPEPEPEDVPDPEDEESEDDPPIEAKKKKGKEVEEEPPKRSLSKKKSNECPFGATYGDDFGQYQECDEECDCNQECSEKHDADIIEKEKKEKASSSSGKRTLLRRK